MRTERQRGAGAGVALIFLDLLDFLAALVDDPRAGGLGREFVLVGLALLHADFCKPGTPSRLGIVTPADAGQGIGLVLLIRAAFGQRAGSVANLVGLAFFFGPGGYERLDRQAVFAHAPGQARRKQGLGFLDRLGFVFAFGNRFRGVEFILVFNDVFGANRMRQRQREIQVVVA